MQVNDAHKGKRASIVLIAVCLVLQLALAPNVDIADGRANLCLVAASLVALTTGGSRGVGVAFGVGLFYDLVTTGPVGLMSFELTLVALLLGSEGRNRLAEDWSGSVRFFLLAALTTELVYAIAMCAVGGAGSFVQVLGLRTIPSVLLDAISFLVVGTFVRGGIPSAGGLSAKGVRGRRGGTRFRTKGL